MFWTEQKARDICAMLKLLRIILLLLHFTTSANIFGTSLVSIILQKYHRAMCMTRHFLTTSSAMLVDRGVDLLKSTVLCSTIHPAAP